MADWTTVDARRESGKRALNLLDNVRSLYQQALIVRDALTLYQSNSDPAFNVTVNAFHPADQRQELGQMVNQIVALINDWEANHAGAIRTGG